MTITNFNWLGGTLNSENAGSNTVTIPTGGTSTSAGRPKPSAYSAGTNGRRLVNRGAGIWIGAGITAYWNTIISNIGSFDRDERHVLTGAVVVAARVAKQRHLHQERWRGCD